MTGGLAAGMLLRDGLGPPNDLRPPPLLLLDLEELPIPRVNENLGDLLPPPPPLGIILFNY